MSPRIPVGLVGPNWSSALCWKRPSKNVNDCHANLLEVGRRQTQDEWNIQGSFYMSHGTMRNADVLRSERGCGGHVGPDRDNTRGQTTVCTGACVRECPVKVGETSQVDTVVDGICCKVNWEMSAACFAKTNSGSQRAAAETSDRHRNNTNWPWTRHSKARSRGSCRGHGGSIRDVAPATRGISNVRRWRWRWRRCLFIGNAWRCRRRCFETWDHVDLKSELLRAWQCCLSRSAWQCCLSQLGKRCTKLIWSTRRHEVRHDLCICGTVLFVSSFLRWHESIRAAKWTILLSFVPARWPFFLRLTFSPDDAVMFFNFVTFRQLRLFAFRIFIVCLTYTNRLVRKIVMTQGIELLSVMWS